VGVCVCVCHSSGEKRCKSREAVQHTTTHNASGGWWAGVQSKLSGCHRCYTLCYDDSNGFLTLPASATERKGCSPPQATHGAVFARHKRGGRKRLNRYVLRNQNPRKKFQTEAVTVVVGCPNKGASSRFNPLRSACNAMEKGARTTPLIKKRSECVLLLKRQSDVFFFIFFFL
jgi:hypothetical protein